MKVGVYVAHDDDAILGVGGRIVQHLNDGDDVYVVIFTDGQNSHKAVLGIKSEPSVWEVKTAREKEIRAAMDVLKVLPENLYFLQLTDGDGKVWQNLSDTKKMIAEITRRERPDVVYFHYPDAHADHRAVSQVMLEGLKGLEPQPEAYQFFIWTKELAKGRPEVLDPSQFPEIPDDALKIDIKKELRFKRTALFEMRSQINVWPYLTWQAQANPILDKKFIEYFLRGEEILIKL